MGRKVSSLPAGCEPGRVKGGAEAMRSEKITLIVALLLLWTLPVALAQKSGSAPAAPKYDVAKEVTFKGTIEEIKETPDAKGDIHLDLMVKSGGDVFDVHLCPSSVLKDLEVQFTKGSEIEVTGAKAERDGKEVILAREIVQGSNTVVLRDKHGAPVWTWLTK
jgi:DNA/RNA endonuclease YhcR with UshA esterase domain